MNIFEAASSGNLDRLDELVVSGEDVDSVTGNDRVTPLILAAKNNRYFIVDYLIESEANINQGDIFGRTPLMWASNINNIRSLRRLLFSNEINVNQVDVNGETAIDWARRQGANDNPIIYNMLRNYGAFSRAELAAAPAPAPAAAPVERVPEKMPDTTDPLAERMECKICMVNIVNTRINPCGHLICSKCYSRLSTQNSYGQVIPKSCPICTKPTNYAQDIFYGGTNGGQDIFEELKEGKLNKINELIKSKGNVNIVDKYNMSLLYIASTYGLTDTVRALIAAGADVNFNNGVDPDYGETSLYVACKNGHIDIVCALITAGVNVNKADGYGNTPIIVAIENNQISIINKLIKGGANVNIVNNKKQSPLHFASAGYKDDAVTILLNAGANINAVNNDGETPLHNATMYGRIDPVRALINAGADINIKDNTGKTAIDVANNDDIKNLFKPCTNQNIFSNYYNKFQKYINKLK
jgi:ankyrin repeat protein